MLQTQKVDLPLVGGLDEKTRVELVQPGSFTALNGLRQVKRGSFQKAPGNGQVPNAIDTGGSISAGVRMFGRRDEMCVYDGSDIYTWVPSEQKWNGVGKLPKALVTRTPYFGVGNLCPQSAVVLVGGMFVMAWTSSITLELSVAVIDASNGATVMGQTVASGSLAAGSHFALTTVGTKAVLVVGETDNAGLITAWTFDSFNPSAGLVAFGSIATDAITGTGFGPPMDVVSLGSRFFLAYVNDHGPLPTNSITYKTFDASLTQLTTATTAICPTNKPTVLAVGASSSTIWIAYNYDALFEVHMLSFDRATTAPLTNDTLIYATTTIPRRITVTGTTASAGVVISSGSLASLSDFYAGTFHINAGVIVQDGGGHGYGIAPCSKIFSVLGNLYFMARPVDGYANNDANQRLCIDLTSFINESSNFTFMPPTRPVATVAPRLVAVEEYTPGAYPASDPLSEVPIQGGVTATTICPILKSPTVGGLELATLSFTSKLRGQAAIMGQTVALTSGIPSTYDGSQVVEMGFIIRPRVSDAGVVAGGSVTVGTHQYVAVFEQQDGGGQLSQSAPSPVLGPITFTAGNQQDTITMSCLHLTNREKVFGATPQVYVVLYRTKAGGTIFYRIDASQTTSKVGQVSVSFNDTLPDDSLGAELYTQPGTPGSALPKVVPPSLYAIVAHEDRLFGVADDEKTIWFTGQQVYGESPWWADQFQLYVETGGPITALASMDGSLIIFKRNKIFFVDGNGPPDNGVGGDFSVPQPVATDVGCIEPRSIVVTPDGVMFQSLRGIELLTRGRQVAPYVGQPVEDTLNANRAITSAVLNEAAGRVIFSVMPLDGGTTGTTIEWDLVFRIWTLRPMHNGTIPDSGVQSAAMIGQSLGVTPIYSWITAAGEVYRESVSSGLAISSQYVSSYLESPWVEVAGLQGFQRVRKVFLQFANNDPADITMSLAFDYSPTYTQVLTFTAAEIASWTTFAQFSMHVANQKCQAIRIKVQDTAPTGGPVVSTGFGPSYFGISLEVGVKPVQGRIPAVQGG